MATQTELQDVPPTAVAEPMEPEKKRNPLVLIIVALVLLVGGYFGWTRYQFSKVHESTDDASVEGDVYPIIPRVSGPVLKVFVADNQTVKKGDTLVTIDKSDYQQRVNAAHAALLAAQAQVTAARAQVGTAQANVRTAQTTIGVSEANRVKLRQDLARSVKLRKDDIIPQSDYDAVQANLSATNAQRSTANDMVTVAREQVTAAQQQVVVAQAVVKQRQADLDNTNLQLSYTTMLAPANGYVSKKNVQPGQVVSPGQQLMGLVSSGKTWVIANFKETQLENMKVGQTAKLEIDSYPNEDFEGHIESLSAATGARFALLPPDNSTGNFVKVTQRIPVKIVLNKEDPEHPLRAGMSVNAIVSVK
ncbi:efflux transporter periplasmic adaptor subunit [Hymenobacter psoromatis]|nr:efflux transporter periplasmic adaptor subunit [Hymenobacter psoromatis]